MGSLCALVALCFAEAAGRTDRSGGPYRYACDAYGPTIGFAVGCPWTEIPISVSVPITRRTLMATRLRVRS